MPDYQTENLKLVHMCRNGNKAAEETLWTANDRLIRSTVKKICRRGKYAQDFDDMYQQAYFGFMQAVNTYDPEKGMPFSTHLVSCVRYNIFRYYQFGSNGVYFSPHMRGRMAKYRKVCAELEKTAGQAADDAIMERMGLTSEEYRNLMEAVKVEASISLDDEITDADGGAVTVGDLIPSGEDIAAEVTQSVYLKELHEALTGALEKLSQKKRLAIVGYYLQGYTYEAIADIFDSTPQAVRGLILHGFREIRTGKYNRVLWEFLYPIQGRYRAECK